MKKKIKIKESRLLCYLGLIFLIVLLLLPPGLRLFGKNLYKKEEKKKDEIVVLSCNKQDETVSSTFLNGEPQNIDYRIKGDYSVKIDKESTETEEEETSKNTLLEYIKPYAQFEYDSNENITIFKVDVKVLKDTKNYDAFFNTIENQMTYYNSQAFYCDRTIY